MRREIDNGKLVGALFVDLLKAFDTIGHPLFLKNKPAYRVTKI